MDPSPIPSHPVLSADETRALEGRLLGADEAKVWAAMLAAGAGVGAAALRDFGETGEFPAAGRFLVLAGKGNNAGDALIAAREILSRFPRASAEILFAFGAEKLGPAAARAWRELAETGCGRAREVGAEALAPSYELCLDGIFGFQYRQPLPPEAAAAIAAAARCAIRLRAAVDLPSGLDEPGGLPPTSPTPPARLRRRFSGAPTRGVPATLTSAFSGTASATASAPGRASASSWPRFLSRWPGCAPRRRTSAARVTWRSSGVPSDFPAPSSWRP